MTETVPYSPNDDPRLHALPYEGPMPTVFNNPFHYDPHPLCRLAAEQLQAYLHNLNGLPRQEIDQGKMFGVLIVERDGRIGYLQAYSGQVAEWDERQGEESLTARREFVPAVVDYLQPDGYFKLHEAGITALNHKIHDAENSPELLLARQEVATKREEATQTIEQYRQLMRQSKVRRDEERAHGAGDEAQRIRESQFQKAELRRIRKRQENLIAASADHLKHLEDTITAMRKQRKSMSDALQRWLFNQFQMLNSRGERRDLNTIFHDFYIRNGQQVPPLPPSGAGECCEPKLLQYAYEHHLRPLQIAMFWWGESPRDEVRHHLSYYPACNGKCKPILDWMLRGLKVAANDLDDDEEQSLQTVYEDSWLLVVNKPAGMLSVPGRGQRRSVVSVLRQLRPDIEYFMVAHRLDMATSGLLIVAKDKATYVALQRMFKNHEIRKRYMACLEDGSLPKALKGEISLPIGPDLHDRPRQKIDREHGKEAVTDYEFIDENRVWLYPKTGRTHQLRLHCAHKEGLGRPIKGDELYGSKADRLYLHAESISFRHPMTGETMNIECKADF